ncbi:hypothetical protein PMY35_07355 [Clostridium tertium]|uniref:hypothetical protein n=1 Tax=Clostridium tertium TaxID=1559 RepID=UPI00232ABB9B|nr:hypothetical protein [Clostridium tertium]MDB1947635.1 hypothetical protein [Clostridium tertium]
MKPILFNTEMVKEIMEGRKAVTRRIIKKTNNKDFIRFVTCSVPKGDEGKVDFGRGSLEDIGNANIDEYVRPPYKVGDILYVRETWSTQYNGVDDDNGYGEYVYKADGVKLDNSEGNCSKWRPSIHMPKEAARIFLKVTNVRVERLQDITEEGAIKEGIRVYTKDEKVYKYALNEEQYPWIVMTREPITPFCELWNSTIKKEQLNKYSWQANPWVWVIEFERIEKGK